jgi:hypothetical protein
MKGSCRPVPGAAASLNHPTVHNNLFDYLLKRNRHKKLDINIGLQSLVYEYPRYRTASVVQWSQFLIADHEVPGTIPGAARFSE